MSKQTRVVLVDCRLTGHHPAFLAKFCEAFLKFNCEVTVLVPCIETAKNLLHNIKSPNLPIEQLKFEKTNSESIKQKFWIWSYYRLSMVDSEIKQIEKRNKQPFDLLFFPYLDDYSTRDLFVPYLLKLPLHLPFSGLLISTGKALPREKPNWKDRLRYSILDSKTPFKQPIGILSEDRVEAVKQLMGTEPELYPDFSIDSELASSANPLVKKVVELSKGRKIVSLLGSISRRKNTELFLKMFENSSDEYFFLIAGRLRSHVFSDQLNQRLQELASNSDPRFHIHDDWINCERVFNSLIHMSNIVFLHYKNFPDSSNVLTKCALLKTPVIAPDKLLIADRVQKFHLGYSVPQSEAEDLLSKPIEWEFDEDRRKQFLQLHEIQRLDDAIQRLLNGLSKK